MRCNSCVQLFCCKRHKRSSICAKLTFFTDENRFLKMFSKLDMRKAKMVDTCPAHLPCVRDLFQLLTKNVNETLNWMETF